MEIFHICGPCWVTIKAGQGCQGTRKKPSLPPSALLAQWCHSIRCFGSGGSIAYQRCHEDGWRQCHPFGRIFSEICTKYQFPNFLLVSKIMKHFRNVFSVNVKNAIDQLTSQRWISDRMHPQPQKLSPGLCTEIFSVNSLKENW